MAKHAHPAPLARPKICREALKIRAVCPSGHVRIRAGGSGQLLSRHPAVQPFGGQLGEVALLAVTGRLLVDQRAVTAAVFEVVYDATDRLPDAIGGAVVRLALSLSCTHRGVRGAMPST